MYYMISIGAITQSKSVLHDNLVPYFLFYCISLCLCILDKICNRQNVFMNNKKSSCSKLKCLKHSYFPNFWYIFSYFCIRTLRTQENSLCGLLVISFHCSSFKFGSPQSTKSLSGLQKAMTQSILIRLHRAPSQLLLYIKAHLLRICCVLHWRWV